MKDYQIWGFTYLDYEREDINAITGDKNESEEEFNIPCFDGLAWFAVRGKFFLCYYPKFEQLTEQQRDEINDYCGYYPDDGEYGVVMGALGVIHEVSREIFDMTVAAYRVTVMDEDNLGF